MAYGLRFYKNFLPELQDCDSTANFCEWIDNLFDALNRNTSGLKIGNTDYKVHIKLFLFNKLWLLVMVFLFILFIL